MTDHVIRDPKKINGMTFLIDGIAWNFSEAVTYVRNCGFSSSETARYLKSLPGYEVAA